MPGATKALGLESAAKVRTTNTAGFAFHGEGDCPLAELDVILMRKDPPFDMEYIYTTYLLELPEKVRDAGGQPARSLRDANENSSP